MTLTPPPEQPTQRMDQPLINRIVEGALLASSQPVTLAQLTMRYGGTEWGNGELAIFSEYWWKTRTFTQWRIAPDQPTAAPEKIVSGSSEDRYADPRVCRHELIGQPSHLV